MDRCDHAALRGEEVIVGLLLLAQVSDPPAAPGAIAPNPIATDAGEVLLTWVEGTKVRLEALAKVGVR